MSNYSTGFGYSANPYAKNPMDERQFSMFPENPRYDPKTNMEDVAPIPMNVEAEDSSPGLDMDGKSAGAAGAKSLAAGGSPEDAASAGLIATGNPYAMAAGVGMSVLAAKKKRDEQRMAELQKLAIEKTDRQQNALARLMNIAQGLKQL